MRIVALILIFLTTFISVLIARAPAAAVLDVVDLEGAGVTYAQVHGSVWNSLLTDVRANGRRIGDVSLRIHPLALFTGQARAELSVRGAGLRGRGQLQAGLNGRLAMRDAQLIMDVSQVEALHDLVRARGGEVLLRFDRIVLDRSGCVEAAGLVVTDVLARPDGRTTWRGPELQGAPACEGSDLVLALDGANEGGAIRVAASLSPDGRAGFTADVETDNTDFLLAAALFGFQNVDGVFKYQRQVRLLDLTG